MWWLINYFDVDQFIFLKKKELDDEVIVEKMIYLCGVIFKVGF